MGPRGTKTLLDRHPPLEPQLLLPALPWAPCVRAYPSFCAAAGLADTNIPRTASGISPVNEAICRNMVDTSEGDFWSVSFGCRRDLWQGEREQCAVARALPQCGRN